MRRARGSVISLVAAVAFVILAIGIGAFFLCRLMGGTRELWNASDAGVMNAAKQALVTPSIQPNDTSLPPAAKDFFALSDPPGTQPNQSGQPIKYKPISLITYNRLVAQAMLVCANAEAEGNETAIKNAKQVVAAVKAVGGYLQNEFAQHAPVDNACLKLTAVNNVRMLDNNGIALKKKLEAGFMNKGYSSNIWFDPDILSTNVPVNPQAQIKPEAPVVKALYDGTLPTNYQSTKFVAGYEPIKLLGDSETLYAVPTMPTSGAHLVDLTRFKQSTAIIDLTTPQNAFRADCQALNKKNSSTFVNTVSCAIVGSLSKYYVGQIPAGYVRVVNAPYNSNGPVPGDLNQALAYANEQLAENVMFDGTQDIFNTNLVFGSSYVQVATPNNGNPETTPFAIGSNGLAAMKAWAAYNDSTGNDGLGHNPNLDPTKNTFPGGTPQQLKINPNVPSLTIRIGSGYNQKAKLKDLVTIKGFNQISDENFNGAEPAWLDAMIPVMESNLSRGTVLAGIGANNGFTAIEWLKARIMQLRAAGNTKITIRIPTQHSGMKSFKHFKNGSATLIHYASPPAHAQFEQVGSPLSLLEGINSVNEPNHTINPQQSSYVAFIKKIAQRTRQINPTFNEAAVVAALNSAPIALGQTLYLHADSTGKKLVMDREVHYDDTNLKPDGVNSIVTYSTAPYDIGLSLVDTQKDGSITAPRGDMNYHQVPYKAISAGGYLNAPPTAAGSKLALNSAATSVTATEAAQFVPSSGFGNLLGEIHYDNALQASNGGNELYFSIPN
ncbi:MAG TPA: hypothetical protein V6C89_17240 [Drouetiella sp.]|jgi:hypothetical protein